jgi:tRNA-splicing ligase RtcB (3'-phosphate/5'-hydroxy nucleic acid ligase)
MSEMKKIAPATYEIAKEGGMRVPGLIIANEELIEQHEMEQSLQQVRNVAHLPGIVGYSIAMPDIHWGYGFPIGGVAAMEIENGVISPGGVGYDINCGVRLAIVPIPFNSLSEDKKSHLLKEIFNLVPSGVGHGHRGERGLSDRDYGEIAEKGARWSIEHDFGLPQDLDHIESYGCIDGGNIARVSQHARDRGKKQLGSIGSGNHFVEIGLVGKIDQPKIAKTWGIEEGLTYVLIHSGSRGFGHQVCQDTLERFIKDGFAKDLPDRQLVAAPIQSEHGKHYFEAMAVAANFAFNNRQQIFHNIRVALRETLGLPFEEVKLIYDVCHNIAKFEEHTVEGKKKKLCVHRKGATRAFGPHHPELAPIFQETGQPVLVPGDMQRCSYLMAALGNPITWSSSCHGAGRAKSRVKSREAWRGRDLMKYMKQQGVMVLASSFRTVAEEMPDAYKDVSIVVKAVEEARLASIVAKLIPHLVIKG